MWPVFALFAAAVGCGAVVPGFVADRVVEAWYGPAGPPRDPSGAPYLDRDAFLAAFLTAIGAFQLCLAMLSLLAALASRTPWRRRLRLNPSRLPWSAYPVLVLGVWSMALASWKAIELLGLDDRGTLAYFNGILRDLRGVRLAAAAVVMALAPGVGEELLFRGHMQTRLTERWGRFASIAVTGVLFAVLHRDWVQGAFVLLLAIYLGEIADRAGSIRPCIACHVALNAAAVLVAPLHRHTPAPVSIAIIVAGAAVTGLCVAYLLRRPVVSPVEYGGSHRDAEAQRPT